jgi:hypothetical protein
VQKLLLGGVDAERYVAGFMALARPTGR